MTKKFTGVEYFVADTREIAEVMGLSDKAAESLIYRATKKFEKKLKERLGIDATIEDIIATLPERGDYEPLQSL